MATEECRYGAPPMNAASATHEVACHHWRDVPDEVPMSIEVDR
jgi:hypothetical protein